MSTVSFLAQLDSGILCLENVFIWPMILVALSLELADIFNCMLLLSRFPVCRNLFVLLFLETPFLVVAVQPFMEWIAIKKNQMIKVSKRIKYVYFEDAWLEKSSLLKLWIGKWSNSDLKVKFAIYCKNIVTGIGVYTLESRQAVKKH